MALTVRGPAMSSAGLRASYDSFERSISRMSSGLRITRAADDAAGLSISESLRSRVTGSAIAVRNVHDGIGILQTAEGGLAAITSMLQRTRDLAVQAANGGGLDAAARKAIAAETQQLVEEIDRTARATGANGIRLLDGSRAGAFVFQVGAEVGDTLSVASSDVRASTLRLLGAPSTTVAGATVTSTSLTTTYVTGTKSFSLYDPAVVAEKFDFSLDGGVTFTAVKVAGEDKNGRQIVYTPEELATVFRDQLVSAGIKVAVVSTGGGESRLEFTADPPTTKIQVGGKDAAQLGFTTTSSTEMTTTTSTGPSTTLAAVSALVDLVTEGSDSAITLVDDALRVVLGERSRFGAVQNRMEHRLSILATTGENLAAARSRIADADMAQEYAGLVRAQLLTQVGTAMQAQSGQGAQRVLQLLSSR